MALNGDFSWEMELLFCDSAEDKPSNIDGLRMIRVMLAE